MSRLRKPQSPLHPPDPLQVRFFAVDAGIPKVYHAQWCCVSPNPTRNEHEFEMFGWPLQIFWIFQELEKNWHCRTRNMEKRKMNANNAPKKRFHKASMVSKDILVWTSSNKDVSLGPLITQFPRHQSGPSPLAIVPPIALWAWSIPCRGLAAMSYPLRRMRPRRWVRNFSLTSWVRKHIGKITMVKRWIFNIPNSPWCSWSFCGMGLHWPLHFHPLDHQRWPSGKPT